MVHKRKSASCSCITSSSSSSDSLGRAPADHPHVQKSSSSIRQRYSLATPRHSDRRQQQRTTERKLRQIEIDGYRQLQSIVPTLSNSESSSSSKVDIIDQATLHIAELHRQIAAKFGVNNNNESESSVAANQHCHQNQPPQHPPFLSSTQASSVSPTSSELMCDFFLRIHGEAALRQTQRDLDLVMNSEVEVTPSFSSPSSSSASIHSLDTRPTSSTSPSLISSRSSHTFCPHPFVET